MKKLFQIFLIILSFIIFSACSFSKEQVIRPDDYKPIPASMSKQYKQEMEQIIDEEYPNIIKKVDEYNADIKSLHDKMVKNGYNFDDYIYDITKTYSSNTKNEIELENKLQKNVF